MIKALWDKQNKYLYKLFLEYFYIQVMGLSHKYILNFNSMLNK